MLILVGISFSLIVNGIFKQLRYLAEEDAEETLRFDFADNVFPDYKTAFRHSFCI